MRSAVGAVIGDPHRVLLGVEGRDDGEGAEDLLLEDAHARIDIGEHGGFDEEAWAVRESRRDAPAGDEPRSLLAADPDEIEHALALAFGNHRSHLGLRRERIANHDRAGLGGELLDEGFVDAALDDVTRGADAGLARSDKGAERGVVDRLVEIEILEDDDRRLASKLERLASEVARCRRAGKPSGLGAAGEHELADAGMLGKGTARHHAVAGDDVEDTGGQARLGEEFGQPQGRQRSEFGRLHHGRAAGGEGRCQIAAGDQQRMVERRHISHHADRQAPRIGQIVALDRNDVVAPCEGEAGIVAEQIRNAGELGPGLASRPAVVQRLEFEEFVEMGLHHVSQLVDEPRTRPDGHAAPFCRTERRIGAPDGAVDIIGRGLDDLADGGACPGGDDVHQLARARIDRFAVDEEALGSLMS